MVDALKLDSAQTLIYVKFHKLLYDNIEIEYNSLYAKTQIVYRSYLVDSQRVGVWAFLLSIIVIGLAAYFNSRDNHELMGPLGWPNEEGPKRAMDTPKNALFIQCLAIMILVVPLMRPIQPQNIDPEKSYWMISLQNWHAPTFIKSFSETDGEKKYQPGRTTVQTTVNNEISLNELKDEMQNISSGLGKNKISLDTIARKLERIRAQMANDINQKIDQ
jgi:hypothetical protein